MAILFSFLFKTLGVGYKMLGKWLELDVLFTQMILD
jgi:hypothetical protein